MIDIQMNVKQGIDLNGLNNSTVRRSKPSAEQRPAVSGNRPDRDQPNRQPVGGQSVVRQPAASQPVGGQSVVRQPAARQPVVNQPVTGSAAVRPRAAGIPGEQGIGAVLKKGQKTSLTNYNPNLKMIDVCLGWDVGGKSQYDVDSECFLLGANGTVVGDEWFVFYNQPVSPDGSVRHNGTHKTGDGCGDDEILHINLAGLNPQVNRLVFILTINEAKEQGLNFGGVRDAYIRVIDKSTNRELVRYLISEYYDTITSMVVGEIYRYKGEWKFTPIGDGTRDDLYGLCTRYGVTIAE